MSHKQTVREQLAESLAWGKAHVTLEAAVRDFPPAHYNTVVSPIPYSAWQLLEHIRIAQWDILDFIRNPDYRQPAWPEEYWPERGRQATVTDWNRTIRQIQADREALAALLADARVALTAPLPHAPEYTLLREILLVADHNAYHIGQLVMLRRLLEIWPAE